MGAEAPQRLDIAAAVGLAIGGVFGLAGAFVGQAELRQELWAIDGVALVVATALLTVKFLRQGNDCVAAGFLVFVAGESLLLSGNAAGLQGSLPSYAGGIALWSASLVMTSVGSTFAVWTRLTGAFVALVFAITGVQISWNIPLLPTSAPLPSIGYPFLVVTFAGWIWRLLRPSTWPFPLFVDFPFNPFDRLRSR